MTSELEPQPTSNQEKLAGLQPGSSSMAAPPTARASLPWEREDANVTVVADETAGAALAAQPSLTGMAAVQPATVPNPPGQAVTPPGVFAGQHPKDLRYWTGTDWDARPLAPVWTRVWCYAIDQTLALLLGLVAAFTILLPLSFLSASGGASSGMDAVLAIISIATWIPVFLLYFAASYALWGRTPGMMLGRLHVIDLLSGARLRWGRAWLRSIVLNVQMLTGIMTLIWLIMTASSPTRQGPHDKAGKSIILRSL